MDFGVGEGTPLERCHIFQNKATPLFRLGADSISTDRLYVKYFT